MRPGKKIVWGICSTIRINSNSKWLSWIGPIGIYGIKEVPQELENQLAGRPYFFRTREEARKVAKAKALRNNKTWTWCKYKVKKYQLSWEEVQ